ncbi:XRE family transcriptional regulator [Acinetobacter ursingii]|uniref:XRE family transcriptional regulator n=1 Tax=Acinetobacter ursingii TaxID=108980 RepID=UPI0021CD498A|nr:XRE family transcriptional regulator [Acinetobacter ursingii]MCU4481241.1 helix-turn-helix domain-containing protein [Acinetobacter ursingii]MCU4505570.1 helix-turn-helix domain-containing protein [Acinetobacter ursingii]MCU4571064.1 helix-turn-helix domain-containing protein [Acinetobacter ursingii]
MNNLLAERFKSERKRLNLSQEGLGSLIDVSESTIKRWENGTAIPSDKLILCAEHGLDIVFILLGKSSNSDLNTKSEFESEFDLVNVYDVKISAGHGSICSGNAEPVSRLAFRKDWLHKQGLHAKDLLIVCATGDSMIPTIQDKEKLLVNSADKELTDGFIYVIRNQDNYWVKRIQIQFDGSLLLISDNKLYPPMQLDLNDASDIEIIGRWVPSSRNAFY